MCKRPGNATCGLSASSFSLFTSSHRMMRGAATRGVTKTKWKFDGKPRNGRIQNTRPCKKLALPEQMVIGGGVLPKVQRSDHCYSQILRHIQRGVL